jgi:glycine/D-amino acid oxidase-like deaminating enzyme
VTAGARVVSGAAVKSVDERGAHRPLVGPGAGSTRRFVCAGWNGHGPALGPRSAQLVAAAVLGERPEPPADFAPARIGRA